MPTVADLRTVSDSLTVNSYPILEPLNAPLTFNYRLARFGDHYNLSNDSHLYRFLVAVCGDTGAGQLKKTTLLLRLEQMLDATQFDNLDRLYGNPLALPRLTDEIYAYNPQLDILNSLQWNEVLTKDSAYRARCLTWMRALIEGPTRTGMKLAVEAATGFEADVWEKYQYIQNPIGTDFGKTSSVNEFVVVPRTLSLTPKDERRIVRLLDQLKPVNTIGTVYSGVSPRTQRAIRAVSSTSDYFYVQRLVTGRIDVAWPTIDLSVGNWIDTTEREAPTYAFMNRQEAVTYLSLASAEASSTHIGSFNSSQRQLFAHLATVDSDQTTFSPELAFDNSVAPINLSTAWMNGTTTTNSIVVNNHYPLQYLAGTTSNFSNVQQSNEFFWASTEKLPTESITETIPWGTFVYGDQTHWGDQTSQINSDWIEFDLDRVRPLNAIHFEICNKPIDWKIQYYHPDTLNWTDLPLKEDSPIMSAVYQPSEQNPWTSFDVFFDLVQTQFIRVIFTRRTDPFPLPTSDPIAFSIDLRGLRLMHMMPTANDFVIDTGTDVLGNAFRTDITTYEALNTIPTTNLVTNPGVESDTSGWSGYSGATVARSTTLFKYGKASALITPSALNTGGGPAVTVVGATQYAYSAWIYSPSGGTYYINLTDGVDQSLASADFVVPAGVWTRIWGIATTDSHTSRNVWVFARNNTSPFYMDGVQVEQNSFITPYRGPEAPSSFWRSQPNPSRNAVEALYFDLRQGSIVGTMSYLDTQFIGELDTRSMADIENYYSNGQLVDEIYIDPITYGQNMHFYYSDDDTPEWDNKLWSPVPRDYILKKGFHALPRPTFVRYFKIEFTNLSAVPYEPVQYPQMPPITFRRYPLWVQNGFESNNSTQDTIIQTDLVAIDPLRFGFIKVADAHVSNYSAMRKLQVTATEPEIATFIQDVLTQEITPSQAATESQINFRSPIMWQSDLIANLDPTRALSRVALEPRDGIIDTGWNAELTLPVVDIPVVASSNDLSQPLVEKTTPNMFFARRSRHNYQITTAPLDRKIAYVVGINQVGFYRRDYTAPIDEPIYVETLDDTAHIESNDFVLNDWRYVAGGI